MKYFVVTTDDNGTEISRTPCAVDIPQQSAKKKTSVPASKATNPPVVTPPKSLTDYAGTISSKPVTVNVSKTTDRWHRGQT
jgi:hypothetical protein